MPCCANSHMPCRVTAVSYVKARVKPKKSEMPIVKLRVVAGRSRTFGRSAAVRRETADVNSHNIPCPCRAVPGQYV